MSYPPFSVCVHRHWTGFQEKHEREWCYLERKPKSKEKDQVVVVFLHGFSAAKESFLSCAAALPREFWVLIPDLPSHGKTAATASTIDEMLVQIAEFVHWMDEPVHLVGCSMGGLLTGLLAAKYPSLVRSITLMCPAGLTMPTKSSAILHYESTGQNLFQLESPEELRHAIPFLFHRPPAIPTGILRYIAHERALRAKVQEPILRDILFHSSRVLEECVQEIEAQTLIIWGREDQVLDLSCLQVLEDKLKQRPKVRIFENAGHVVQREKARKCAVEIQKFIADYNGCERDDQT